jgi:hypothetical protein
MYLEAKGQGITDKSHIQHCAHTLGSNDMFKSTTICNHRIAAPVYTLV